MVHPGDLLHGDRNGVTTIPHEIASAVAHACGVHGRRGGRAGLPQGRAVTPKGFAEARAACKDRIDVLARRLKKG